MQDPLAHPVYFYRGSKRTAKSEKMLSLEQYEQKLKEKELFDAYEYEKIDRIFDQITRQDLKAKRTDKEKRPIPGVPPMAPKRKVDEVFISSKVQSKYDDFDRDHLKKQRLDFDKDMERIEKDLKKEADQELEWQQD